MSLSADHPAIVRVRCELGTAALIANLGLLTDEEDDGPVAHFECSSTSDLFIEAAMRCEVRQDPNGLLVADTARRAQRLIDRPVVGEVVDDRGDPCIWDEPEVVRVRLPPMRLGKVHDLGHLCHLTAQWLQQFEEVDGERFSTSMARWNRRAAEVYEIATDRANSALGLGSTTQARRVELSRALERLHWRVLYPPNAENDLEVDPEGEAYVPSRGTVINRSLRKVFDVIHSIEGSEGERERRESVLSDARDLMELYVDQLPDRILLAIRTDMVSESLGAIRAALLELDHPGWTWAPDYLRDAVNPSEEALAELLAAREVDQAIRLRYEPTGRRTGHYVLVADFLGREIFRRLSGDDVTASDAEGGG